ncbi:CHRD domain-containing protein [Lacibacter luteus]|uniref:CHRD domain-containing protein n=1 Tax=Lacibacter luteus TaxID=2508719 RepID=A0A4Q1CJS2_9BACT|nr:CHRD domain-containing protein [Lacibacter luteus]RXK60627.1 CHRD domain-containing protein [Lacibacter luteus]
MKSIALKSLLVVVSPIILFSCKKEKAPSVTIVKEWNVSLSAKYENPAPAGRNETGTANFKLMSDNSLSYSFSVMGLASGDALTAAHFHVGDAGTNGGVILNFNPTFSGAASSGTVMNIRQTLVDSLKSNANEIYFNVHSTQVASGLVRSQINTKIDFAADIALSGANEVPAVTTTATGTARIRVTSDKKMYSIVTVTNLEAGDALTAAHIHSGAAGVNGGVLIGLASTSADFAIAKVFMLTDAIYNSVKADALYVNAHSTLHASGVVRGQIR